MPVIKATIGQEKYATFINSETGNTITADEPYELGGKNMGLRPASC